jgi:hypothetical protein
MSKTAASARASTISSEVPAPVSSRACVYGCYWGYDQRGVWVNDGCPAFFEVTYYPNH